MNSLLLTLLLAVAWPQTPACAVAEKWVRAFNKGEDAMRAFVVANVPEDALKKRPAEERVVKYKELRERYRSFTMTEVVQSTPDEVQVRLTDGAGAPHLFTFTVQPDEPHKLLTVKVTEQHHGAPPE